MRVLYFAWLRGRIGVGEEEVEALPPGTTARGLIAVLVARGPGHAAAFADLRAIKVAIDQEFASLDAPLDGAREVAFFPPVTGG
jgi:molybdopterin synthase sulfur carrier subunit